MFGNFQLNNDLNNQWIHEKWTNLNNELLCKKCTSLNHAKIAV